MQWRRRTLKRKSLLFCSVNTSQPSLIPLERCSLKRMLGASAERMKRACDSRRSSLMPEPDQHNHF